MDVIALAKLAAYLDADLTGADPTILVGPDVVIDSRLATRGSLFVALAGERTDGHDFLTAAAERGAVAALVSRPVPDAGLAQVVVADPALALAELAKATVASYDGLDVIGITGSSGKTSTKDLVAQILESWAPTVAPQGSFNNEIGVPLTALRVDRTTRFLVSEMGARGKGHIAWLCDLVRPNVGVVCNVGTAHLGEFGSVAGIVAAKGELVEALPTDGWAVLNADDPRVSTMAGRTRARLAWFAANGRPDRDGALIVWAEDLASSGERYSFSLGTDQGGNVERAGVQLHLVGRHHVSNALAAAAATLALGVPLAVVAEALSAATPRSRWRMEITERADGVTVVNDAYNANPDSMRAALATVAALLAERRRTNPGARLVAVLGDMLELGDAAPDEHAAIGALAAQAGASTLVAVGEYGPVMGAAAAGDGTSVRTAATRDNVVELLPQLSQGDIVLLKASRGVGLDTVATALLEVAC